MKLHAALLLSLLAVAPALADEPKAPAWLQDKITGFKNLPPFNPPRSIVATRHEGKKVYYVSAACCDIPSELYDESGTLLCYPDGGFAGGDGRCRSFFLGRAPTVTVWRDERSVAAPASGASPGRR